MVIQSAVLAHEVLKLDWFKNNEHSWYILGVRGFRGRTVNGKGGAGIEHGKQENENWNKAESWK